MSWGKAAWQPWSRFQILDMIAIPQGTYGTFLGIQLLVVLPLDFLSYVGAPVLFVVAEQAYGDFLSSRWWQVHGLSEEVGNQEKLRQGGGSTPLLEVLRWRCS